MKRPAKSKKGVSRKPGRAHTGREKPIHETIIANACKLPGCWAFKLHGSQYSIGGMPDVWIIRFGRLACVECKRPGEHAKPLQDDLLARLASIGVVTGTASSWSDVAELLINGGMMIREEIDDGTIKEAE
jgi:hypothetical protein